MFKLFIFAAILAFAVAVPAPEPKAEPKPGFIATTYGAQLVSAPAAISYSAYNAPVISPYIANPYVYSPVVPRLYY